jgi:hypothetical protein
MSYQAVIRDQSQQLVGERSIGIRVSILQGSETGIVVFQETYNPNPTSNQNGLITLEIGDGVAITGKFEEIDWTVGPFFLKTEYDLDGGISYSIDGTMQILSVPYSLYAKKAGKVDHLQLGDIEGVDVLGAQIQCRVFADLLAIPGLAVRHRFRRQGFAQMGWLRMETINRYFQWWYCR